MASLLYISVRPERAAADAEYASFRRGLGVAELDRLDLLTAPLDPAAVTGHRGIVIGGSPLNVTDPAPTAEQRRVESDLERIAAAAIDGGTAALFTCYGIGVVTRMLGGIVTVDHPESASAVTIRATEAARQDPIFGPSGPELHVFTAHKESAAQTPPTAELLAEGDACPVQAYRVGTHLYATQFHPEPSPADFAERMTFYRTKGYFDANAFDAVQQRVLAETVTEGEALLARFAATFASP
ncbi:GMP synthase [Microbacterium sp. CIAB417]|uniref:glutamine amidotransferase-related protein n=1 Tax=Microbacterium sp. CIAB417 TaxID=2860287 RepID=UPI001FAE369C|nr:GMP synthase [Microbacterium sp. CIAB417]